MGHGCQKGRRYTSEEGRKRKPDWTHFSILSFQKNCQVTTTDEYWGLGEYTHALLTVMEPEAQRIRFMLYFEAWITCCSLSEKRMKESGPGRLSITRKKLQKQVGCSQEEDRIEMRTKGSHFPIAWAQMGWKPNADRSSPSVLLVTRVTR